MGQYLSASAFLALLVTALGTGCGGEPALVVTRDKPAGVQVERGEAAVPTRALTYTSAMETKVTVTPTPKPLELGLSADARAVFALSREDLAQRLGLPSKAISLVSVESLKWPDASLGCPRPGIVYAQVITPGFRIILKAAGKVYEYHADREQLVILCEKATDSSKPAPTGPIEPSLEGLANQVREDLAQRLSISVAQIEVLESRSVVWPDGGLGCPEPGVAYTQVPQEGVLIRLRAGQRIYSYHGGAGTPPFLCVQATTDNPPSK